MLSFDSADNEAREYRDEIAMMTTSIAAVCNTKVVPFSEWLALCVPHLLDTFVFVLRPISARVK
jgi:hypothetical protein